MSHQIAVEKNSIVVVLEPSSHHCHTLRDDVAMPVAFSAWVQTDHARVSVIGANGEYRWVGDALPIAEYAGAVTKSD